MPKVFVSGCFDLLHSGHIAFLKSAAEKGDLYVALGSDKTIFELKNKKPIYNEGEREYILNELSCVKKAFVSKGSGILDFEKENLEKINKIRFGLLKIDAIKSILKEKSITDIFN